MLKGTAKRTHLDTLTDAYNIIQHEQLLSEKVLTWVDFSSAMRKHSRLAIIDKKIKKGEPFEIEGGVPQKLSYANEEYSKMFADQDVNEVKRIGGFKINQFPFFKTENGKEIGFANLTKTKEFGGAGAKADTSERQERGLIDVINSKEGLKTLISKDGIELKGVLKAEKVEKIPNMPEPYSDIKLHMEDGSQILVSAKGNSAPTLGSGGLSGISILTKHGNNPDILNFVADFYKKAYHYYEKVIELNNLKGDNLYKNKLIPDVSIKIPHNILHSLLMGNESMGGPVSYYYIGDMDVEVDPSSNDNVIKILNGKFISLENFIKQYADTLYAHIRKRDGDIFFTDNTFNLNGKYIPTIFMKKNAVGRGVQSRFGIADKVRGALLQ